jgi:hypothetical protein
MLGTQFGIMLTQINISQLSGCHRTTRLHARWQSCGRRPWACLKWLFSDIADFLGHVRFALN